MKIAVLMIGHIKNSIKMENHKRIIDNILENNDCDLFIYTNKHYSFRNKLKNNRPEANVEEFYNLYKKYIKKIIIQEYEPDISRIMERIRKRRMKILRELRKINPKFDYPRCPVINKLAFLNDIKNRYSRENNITYDYVLIARPDNESNKVIDFTKINLKEDEVMYSEWYAFGRENSMNIYANKGKYFVNPKYTPFTFKKCYSEMDLFKRHNIKVVNTKRNNLLGMKLPVNSNTFYPEHVPYDETISNNKRVFIVKDYSKENKESDFYKNYKSLDNEMIEFIKNKYKELI